MARIHLDKKGKVTKTEPGTKPHPRPQARDSKGKPFYQPPEPPTMPADTEVAPEPEKEGPKK